MKTIAYIRISTDRQDLDSQRYGLNEFAISKGLTVDKWIEDIVTGRKRVKDRKLGPELEALEKGDCLIIPEMSRMGRGMYDILSTLKYCLDRGIQVMTVKEGWILGNDIQSKIMAFAFGIAAEIERELISSRTRDALRMRKRKDQVYGHLAYGKGRNGNMIEASQEESEVIAGMIELRDLGLSYRKICDKMNTNGVLCRGRNWNVKKVYKTIQRYATK